MLVAAVSCGVDSDIILPAESDDAPDRIYASFETQDIVGATKIYIGEDYKLYWNAGDHISFYNNEMYNYEYKFDGSTGDRGGSFSKVNTVLHSKEPLPHKYAVYPYSTDNIINDNAVISLNVSATQNYATNSFGVGDNIMVAAEDDESLFFKNACGYLRFKLYGKMKVSSVSLTGKKDEKISGPAIVTMEVGGNPVLKMTEDAGTMITVSCETPVSLEHSAEKPTEFWFVVPPVTFSEGFTLSISDPTGETCEVSTSKSFTISRNTITSLAPVSVNTD